MNEETVKKLLNTTKHFYAQEAESFSASRKNPWSGFDKLSVLLSFDHTTAICDLACGNMRLKNFLDTNNCTYQSYIGMDVCEDLVPESHTSCFKKIDIADCLLHKKQIFQPHDVYTYIYSIGFFHHVPSRQLRKELLMQIINHLEPHGKAILTFWQYAKSDSLRKKSKKVTPRAIQKLGIDKNQLEDGDGFFSWSSSKDVFRYCHNFTNEEIDNLLATAQQSCRLLSTFSCDGRGNNLNRYIILEKMCDTNA